MVISSGAPRASRYSTTGRLPGLRGGLDGGLRIGVGPVMTGVEQPGVQGQHLPDARQVAVGRDDEVADLLLGEDFLFLSGCFFLLVLWLFHASPAN